jgi:hypothetical protein
MPHKASVMAEICFFSTDDPLTETGAWFWNQAPEFSRSECVTAFRRL